MDPFLLIGIIVALIGTAYASYSDLKTTEVADWVPIVMGSSGLAIHGFHSFLSGDYTYVIKSALIGSAFLAYGVLVYKLGQWGGADAGILAAIGFLVPFYPNFSYFGLPIPYAIGLVLNVYLLGAIYALGYALVLALRKRHVFKIFINDIKENRIKLSAYFAGLCAIVIGISFGFSYALGDLRLFYASLSSQLVLLPIFLFLLFYWRFAKVVETNIFRWKIASSKLKVGDMLAHDVRLPHKTISAKYIEGLTISQVREIKKHTKSVTIKEGVRFIPAFLLGLIFTLLMNRFF